MSIQDDESVAFDVIRSNGVLRTFPPNIELFRQGQLTREVFLLDQGKVKMTRTEYCGDEMIIEINDPVQILGVASIISQIPSTATATTLTACRVFSLHTHSFLTSIEQEPGLTKSLLKLISQYSCEQTIRQAQLGTSSSRRRLASILLNQVSSKISNKDGIIKINMPIKKKDIAGLLAIRPEQVSRHLAELKNKGIIDQEQGWIIVTNLEALIHESGGE